MNIIIAINEKYLEPAKTMLYSLGCHSEERNTIHLLYSSISEHLLQAFEQYVYEYCKGIVKSYRISEDTFSQAPKQKWWTNEIYYRLLAFDILPPIIERALWLDADIIINGSLSDFYAQEFGNYYAVVCKGCNQSLKDNLGLPMEHDYFNSGVILYNLKKIREDFVPQDFIDCIKQNAEKLQAPDQDILNILFCGFVKYADEKIYNNETFGNYVLAKEKIELLHYQTKIIHFNGSIKPWNPKGANWADDLWWKYERKRGRKLQYINYRMQNLPVKVYYQGREICFIIKNKMKSLVKSKL